MKSRTYGQLAALLTLCLVVACSRTTKVAKQTELPILLQAAIRSLPDVQTDPLPLVDGDGHPVIIPQPKQAVFTGDDYPLRGHLPVTTVGLRGTDGRRVRGDLARLTAQLQREAGVRVEQGHGKRTARGLLVAIAGRPSIADHLSSGLPPTCLQIYLIRLRMPKGTRFR